MPAARAIQPAARVPRALQRACACGQPAKDGGECEECRKKKDPMLQRHAAPGTGLSVDFAATPAGLPRLPVNAPGDAFEREADAMAEAVLAVRPPGETASPPSPFSSRAFRSSNPGALRREVAPHAGGPAVAPPIVHDVLRASGAPLDAATRAELEPRFGHDFSGVRVHTDGRAAASARAVQATAYTVGRDIVFGSGAYAPHSAAGRRLLAHELAHVVQQGASGRESASFGLRPSAWPPAERRLQRTVVNHCSAGQKGAPANPAHELDVTELFAGTLATLSSVLANGDATGFRLLGSAPTSNSYAAYQARFGPPPAAGAKFRNRVTGARFDTRDEAAAAELGSLAGRLQRIAGRLERNIHYFCISGSATRMDCAGHCQGRDATACPGKPVVLLCPGFWNLSTTGRATLLIHELAHMVLGVLHGTNFTHASCYANFVADLSSAPTTNPECRP